MPKIKLSHVVSCSSEDPVHNSDNLLNVDPKKKFLCKTKGESSVSIILQFEKSCRICSIDIANANSAFVEIFAGRSSSKEENYEMVLPMSSFMTPMDAVNMTNSNRVRLFTADDLSPAAKQEKWDRVKIICTQPFNKNVQYGLTFVALGSKDEEIADFGKFNVRPASPVQIKTGTLFSKRKELSETKTIVQEIRAATTPECAKIRIKAGSSKKAETTESELKKQMNRNNRRDLFYDSDDDKNAAKVDKVVEQVKQKQQNEQNGGKKQTKNETSDRRKKMEEASTSVKRTSTSENSVKKRVKMSGKPFEELLSDVVFTISGFVNPERADIRQSGLNMGAKYRKDWDNSCTHLICAFANTPKFQQVRGKGKIIKKEWLYDCNSQRRRLPWRRYALDKNDVNQPESEDELCEKTNDDEEQNSVNNSVNSVKRSDYLSGSDTDEEIQKIIKLQQNNKKCDKDEAFDVETDEEQLEKNTKNISDIPRLFNTEIFYIDSVFSEKETEKLERLIKSFNGVVIKRISAIIDYVVTDEQSKKNIQNRISGAKFVTKDWIFDCHDQMVLVPYDKYVLN